MYPNRCALWWQKCHTCSAKLFCKKTPAVREYSRKSGQPIDANRGYGEKMGVARLHHKSEGACVLKTALMITGVFAMCV
jgi:hypothetical protein